MLVGVEHLDHCGPWRQAIAGGQRIIELRPNHDRSRQRPRPLPADPRRRRPRPDGSSRSAPRPRTAGCARPSCPPPDQTSPPERSPHSPPPPTCTSASCFAAAAPAAATPASAHTSRSSRSTRPDALKRLDQYRCPPTIVIASGGSPGHAHAYWQLLPPVELDELEQANRRLAIRLGGDLASVDAARILRPPSSLNHKRSPPTAVMLLSLHADRCYDLAELTAGLPDPPARRPAGAARRRATTGSLDQALLAIPAATYAQALTGLRPTAPARSAARSTTTAPQACSSTTTTGTASDAASGAPSTTSGLASTASAPAAASSYSSASASLRSCCRSL